MGMFDWVDYQAPCAKCGVVITKWQSKDGPCKLEKVRVQDVGHLYTSCDTCGQWNQYEVVLDAPIPVVPYHLVAQHRGMEQETEDEQEGYAEDASDEQESQDRREAQGGQGCGQEGCPAGQGRQVARAEGEAE